MSSSRCSSRARRLLVNASQFFDLVISSAAHMQLSQETQQLIARVTKNECGIEALSDGIESLIHDQRNIGGDTSDHKHNLDMIISEVGSVLKVIAFEDERVAEVERQAPWTNLLPSFISSQLRRWSHLAIKEDLQGAINRLRTVGESAGRTVSEAQRLQEEAANLSSVIAREAQECQQIQENIQTLSKRTRVGCDVLGNEVQRYNEEIHSSEEMRALHESMEEYHGRKADHYNTAGKVFLLVPGVNIFASSYCFWRKHRNSEKSADYSEQSIYWVNKTISQKSKKRIKEARISELQEETDYLDHICATNKTRERFIEMLGTTALQLVDGYQELSDSSYEVARTAQRLQSRVVQPVNRAHALGHRSIRQEGLQSTRRMIEVLERGGFNVPAELRATQASLEDVGVPETISTNVARLGDI